MTTQTLNHSERLSLLLEHEILMRENRKQERLVRQAQFKLNASVQEIDYSHPRNIQKKHIAQLATGDWLGRHQNLLITGPCGSGKTYLACALGHAACLQGHSARYWRLSRLMHDLMEILDDRHGSRSTLVISQLPTDQWYASIGDNTLADAILDRLMHNAHQLKLKGESMRQKLGKLTDGEQLK